MARRLTPVTSAASGAKWKRRKGSDERQLMRSSSGATVGRGMSPPFSGANGLEPSPQPTRRALEYIPRGFHAVCTPDSDAAGGGGAVAPLLALDVQRADRRAPGQGFVVQQVGGDDPGDLELDAVGILAVQALGRAVVAGPHEGARLGQGAGQPLQPAQRVHL